MGTRGSYNPIGAGVLGINAQTGTTYTLVLSDSGKYVTLSNAATVYVTVPPDVFPVNTVITLEQKGVGVTVMLEGAGVTINGYDSGYMSPGQYAAIQLICTASNIFTCIGGAAIDFTTTTITTA